MTLFPIQNSPGIDPKQLSDFSLIQPQLQPLLSNVITYGDRYKVKWSWNQ